jgi:hypothetical protein
MPLGVSVLYCCLVGWIKGLQRSREFPQLVGVHIQDRTADIVSVMLWLPMHPQGSPSSSRSLFILMTFDHLLHQIHCKANHCMYIHWQLSHN